MANQHLILYYIGISIVFITHIVMLLVNIKPTGMIIHAIINIIAAIFIAYYFMNKEGYIKF